MKKMSAKKVLNVLLSLVVFCGLFAFSASVVKADDASVEKARAVLVRLIEFSNKQQLRSRAAQELLTGEMLRLNIASFVIGGIMDNTVGFVYSPSNKPPQISPSSYIWVEEIAAGWYLFRTT
jgi:hypothetical protein